MAEKHLKLQKKMTKRISILLALVLSITFTCSSKAVTKEVPEEIFEGVDNASVILNNISYRDVNNTWAKEAVYQTGALGIMKGYGDRYFGLPITISKEQAIAIAYRAAGREADAQKAAEALDNARQVDEKKKNAISMWSDGYLQLAANEGLITTQELNDAFNTDQTSLIPGTSFIRSAPAQRQEMAVWIAKALKLEPIYGQDSIFNSFNDWKNADPIKVPYIEAALQNKIMNGNGNGSFSPTGRVTREQAAQIMKNAEDIILPVMKCEIRTGTVEEINNSVDYSQGEKMTTNTFSVRNSNGKLHRLDTQYLSAVVGNNMNEQAGVPLQGTERDFIVYRNGQIGKSRLLKQGDRLKYIVDDTKKIRFVKVISSVNDTRYIAAQVNSIDMQNLTLYVTQLLELDYPEIKDMNLNKNESSLVSASYRYSNSVEVMLDGKKAGIDGVKTNSTVILTIWNGMVTSIAGVDISLEGDKRVVKGIVEDNNPQLGYITLYGEGASAGTSGNPKILRTYNYANQNVTEVYKNGKKADVGDVEPGDSVFIRLDESMYVSDISAADNYDLRYGTVVSKRPSSIAVEFENDVQQVLPVDGSIPVVRGGSVVGYGALSDGDRVRLLLNVTDKQARVKEITIESNRHAVKNIYKGKVAYIDDVTGKLVVMNLEKLDKGQWTRTDNIGVSEMGLNDRYRIYKGDTLTDIPDVNRNLKNMEAYIASENDYGKEEKAAVVAFRNADDTETVIDDSVSSTKAGTNEFGLTKGTQNISYGQGSIIIKDGRIVAGSSISADDPAYIVANRNNDDGKYYAGVVQINERQQNNLVTVYRGRIKGINDNRDFTVESYSQLKGTNWEYYNTPKTFKITYDTRILGDAGIIAQRDFIGYGDDTYIGRSVYVLADDINAVMVSTAPYGPDGAHAKGRIYEITGGSIGEDGTVLEEPTGIKLRDAKAYDTTKYIWADSKDITLNILKNSVILKNNKAIKPSELTKGDILRVYKKGNGEDGDAYIIFVEE